MTSDNKKKFDAYELRAMLAEKYKSPEYAFLQEVGSGTGANSGRYADAMAMSLWPSRGLHLMGFEIKVSRTDWLKEKEMPEKADAIARYCDFWYLVVGSTEIVQNGELPPTWGFIAPRGDKLVVSKEAQQLTPQPMDRKFLAALLRRASEVDRRSVEIELSRARDASFQEGKKIADSGLASKLKHVEEYYELLKKSVAAFQEKSGIKIDCWNGGNIGDTLSRVVRAESDVKLTFERIGHLKRSTEIIIATIDALKRDEQAVVESFNNLRTRLNSETTQKTN